MSRKRLDRCGNGLERGRRGRDDHSIRAMIAGQDGKESGMDDFGPPRKDQFVAGADGGLDLVSPKLGSGKGPAMERLIGLNLVGTAFIREEFDRTALDGDGAWGTT